MASSLFEDPNHKKQNLFLPYLFHPLMLHCCCEIALIVVNMLNTCCCVELNDHYYVLIVCFGNATKNIVKTIKIQPRSMQYSSF